MREPGATEVAIGVTAAPLARSYKYRSWCAVEMVARVWDWQAWGDVSLIS